MGVQAAAGASPGPDALRLSSAVDLPVPSPSSAQVGLDHAPDRGDLSRSQPRASSINSAAGSDLNFQFGQFGLGGPTAPNFGSAFDSSRDPLHQVGSACSCGWGGGLCRGGTCASCDLSGCQRACRMGAHRRHGLVATLLQEGAGSSSSCRVTCVAGACRGDVTRDAHVPEGAARRLVLSQHKPVHALLMHSCSFFCL